MSSEAAPAPVPPVYRFPLRRESRLVHPEITWSRGDAEQFQVFLTKNKNFLHWLADRLPKIDMATTERSALSGCFHAGAEYLFEVICSMTEAQDTGLDGRSPFVTDEEEGQQ